MLANKRATGVRVGAKRTTVSVARPLVSSKASMGTWYSAKHTNELAFDASLQGSSTAGPSRKTVTMMGNKATGGIFSPAVTVVRNIMGEKEFNKLRGKAISLHSQIIKDFCKLLGVENKQVQGVIRLAKKNGEWLGFLA